MDSKIKKLVATVALAGAVTVGTAGVAVAADGSEHRLDRPARPRPAGATPCLRREVSRGAVKVVTDTLGVSRQDLRAALKGGQTISQYATSLGKDPQARDRRAGQRGEHQARPAGRRRHASSRTVPTPSRARSRPGSTR